MSASKRQRFVGFIRNVMIGRGEVTKQKLLDAFAACGATDVESILGTGNVLFSASRGVADAMPRGVRARLLLTSGLDEPSFIRSVATLRALSFPEVPEGADVHERCVTFLDPPLRTLPTLPWYSTRRDVCIIGARAASIFSVTYLVSGRPGSAGGLLERHFGRPATTRNWNTIERILARALA